MGAGRDRSDSAGITGPRRTDSSDSGRGRLPAPHRRRRAVTTWRWVAIRGSKTHYAQLRQAEDGTRWYVLRCRCGVKPRRPAAWPSEVDAPGAGSRLPQHPAQSGSAVRDAHRQGAPCVTQPARAPEPPVCAAAPRPRFRRNHRSAVRGVGLPRRHTTRYARYRGIGGAESRPGGALQDPAPPLSLSVWVWGFRKMPLSERRFVR